MCEGSWSLPALLPLLDADGSIPAVGLQRVAWGKGLHAWGSCGEPQWGRPAVGGGGGHRIPSSGDKATDAAGLGGRDGAGRGYAEPCPGQGLVWDAPAA